MKSTERAGLCGLLIVLAAAMAGCNSASSLSADSQQKEADPQRQKGDAEASPAALEPASPLRTADRSASQESSPAEDSPAAAGLLAEADGPVPGTSADEDQAAPGVDQVAAKADENPLASWPQPRVALVLTGRQHGYIEPCGCTGLDRQKGGLARRHTFIQRLRDEQGWSVVALDAGDQVRRFGRQAEIKFQITVEALRTMGYSAATLGLDDLRLSIDELAATTAEVDGQPSLFVSANVAVLDREFTPRLRILEAGGKRIAVTGVLGDQARKQLQADELLTEPAAEGLAAAWAEMDAADCDYHVLLAQATLDETLELARAVPHFQLVVTSGGGEEPSYEAEAIEGTPSTLVKVGAKGMYAGVIGLFDDAQRPWRYARVALDHGYADSKDMRDLMATYQNQLERLGLEGLGLRPVTHPSGRTFVGSQACQECHKNDYEVWESSMHAHALDTLVHPGERSDVARHFDPECISCHVTGWNPQRYFPYDSGYLSLDETPQLVGVGCENCHGPGSAHVAAQQPGSGVDAAMKRMLREQMRLDLQDAEKKCMECHDLDNSPDFHSAGAFDQYWQQIEH